MPQFVLSKNVACNTEYDYDDTKDIVGDMSTIENDGSESSVNEISPGYLSHLLDTNLHETCKKYDLYFVKVNGEWTINNCSKYENQYIESSDGAPGATPEPRDSIFDKIYGVTRLVSDTAHLFIESIFDYGYFKRKEVMKAKHAELRSKLENITRIIEAERYLYESSKRTLNSVYNEGNFPEKDQEFLMKTYTSIVDNELKLSIINTQIKVFEKHYQ